MARWQIWQLAVKILCLGMVILLEHVISMPLLSLLLLYWWFGRSHYFSVVPIIVFSIALGLLYGGLISTFYIVLGLWWWLTTRKIGAKWLNSLVLFGSASAAVTALFLIDNRVRLEFAVGWIAVAGVVWWRLYAANRGAKHGS